MDCVGGGGSVRHQGRDIGMGDCERMYVMIYDLNENTFRLFICVREDFDDEVLELTLFISTYGNSDKIGLTLFLNAFHIWHTLFFRLEFHTLSSLYIASIVVCLFSYLGLLYQGEFDR